MQKKAFSDSLSIYIVYTIILFSCIDIQKSSKKMEKFFDNRKRCHLYDRLCLCSSLPIVQESFDSFVRQWMVEKRE